MRSAFLEAFTAATNTAFSDATTYSPDQVASWPILTLVFAGTSGRVQLELSPAKYTYMTANGQYKIGLHFAASGGTWMRALGCNSDLRLVVGANAMVDVNVLFDLDAQQVGFTRANCTLTTETSTTASLGFEGGSRIGVYASVGAHAGYHDSAVGERRPVVALVSTFSRCLRARALHVLNSVNIPQHIIITSSLLC